MRSKTYTLAMIATAVVATSSPLGADVQTQEKTHVQFAGPLGRMVNMFGGKAAKQGIVQTVAVKGDRMMTTNDKTAELIDMAEEKVYHIDLDGKSYTVLTFAEMRQKMQEAQEKAKQQMASAKEHQEKEKPTEPQKKMAVDVSTKETGQTKTVNGFDCKEVVTVVTMHEDGKTIEQSGGMVMTTDSWMTKPIPAIKEVTAFRRRYFEKLSGMDPAAAAEQMAQAMAMYPQLKEMMGRTRVEGAKVDGTAISTLMTVDTVPSPEEKTQQAESKPAPEPAGGLSGMLARKMMKKKQADDTAAGGADTGHSSLMSTTHEVLSVSSTVSPDAVSIPAGFKQKS